MKIQFMTSIYTDLTISGLNVNQINFSTTSGLNVNPVNDFHNLTMREYWYTKW